MSERYCGFILIMPGKNRISIAQQTRISIAQHCLPKAGTSASWLSLVVAALLLLVVVASSSQFL